MCVCVYFPCMFFSPAVITAFPVFLIYWTRSEINVSSWMLSTNSFVEIKFAVSIGTSWFNFNNVGTALSIWLISANDLMHSYCPALTRLISKTWRLWSKKKLQLCAGATHVWTEFVLVCQWYIVTASDEIRWDCTMMTVAQNGVNSVLRSNKNTLGILKLVSLERKCLRSHTFVRNECSKNYIQKLSGTVGKVNESSTNSPFSISRQHNLGTSVNNFLPFLRLWVIFLSENHPDTDYSSKDKFAIVSILIS